MLLWEMQGWAAIALNAQPRNSINRYPEKKGEKGEKKGDRYNSIAPSSDGSMTSSRKCVPVPIFPTFFLAIFPPCAARGAATDLGGIVHSIEGIVLGEMADELLLASTRVVPNVLQESGYEFHFPELEPALRYLLGR